MQQGVVDRTLYDTTTILPLIIKLYGLPTLAGLKAHDTALAATAARRPAI